MKRCMISAGPAAKRPPHMRLPVGDGVGDGVGGAAGAGPVVGAGVAGSAGSGVAMVGRAFG
ncbi:MAG: hypothetical protein OHK0024_14560 [Thalassobaculales bacterium]